MSGYELRQPEQDKEKPLTAKDFQFTKRNRKIHEDLHRGDSLGQGRWIL